MARPFKKGLEYFPLDSNFLSNRKTQRLIHRFGCNGICVYLGILCEIYGENGYYIPFSDNFCFDIGFTLKLDEQQVREIIDFCVAIHLFDTDLLNKKHVLSSKGIQMRFNEVYKRTPYPINPELNLCLSDSPETCTDEIENYVNKTGDYVNITTGYADKTPNYVDITPDFDVKTPTKGKGNKKENRTTQNSNFYGNQTSTDNGETERKAELLRMAAQATGSGENA